MTKRLSILVIIAYGLISTACDTVRQAAIKYEYDSELNGIIEYYSQCYYSLPKDKKDILSFLSSWKSSSPDSYCYDLCGDDMISHIQKDRIRISSYEDSIFLFIPKKKAGCCVYGTPGYWLDHPELYGKSKASYEMYFRSSTFDVSGDYLFDYDTNGLEEMINAIKQEYSDGIYAWLPIINEFDDETKYAFAPYRVIVTCNADSSYETYYPGSSQKFRIGNDEKDLHTLDQIQEMTQKYLSRIIDCACLWLSQNKKVNRVVFVAELMADVT